MKNINEVRQKLKEQIDKSQEHVLSSVEDHYVDSEIKRRSKLIIKGLDKLEVLEKERDQIKPDQVIVDEEGKEQNSGYSKQAYEKLKKAREAVDKTTKALNAAIENGTHQDYEKLEKVLN